MATPTFVAAVVVSLVALTPTGDWYVDGTNTKCEAANGGSAAPYCTIAEAIVAAMDGDTIHIAPSSYFENLISDKDLTFVGTAGALQTIVDGSASGSVLTLTEGTHTVLRGLTLQNGEAFGRGGITLTSNVSSASLRIEGCVVQSSRAIGSFPKGGGVYTSGADLTLIDTTVRDNRSVNTFGPYSDGQAGGIYFERGDLTVVNCVIEDNSVLATEFSGGGGIFSYDGDVVVVDTVFRNNRADNNFSSPGGGLLAFSSDPSHTAYIVRSSFHGNRSRNGGGASIHMPGMLENVEFFNNITSADGSALSFSRGPTLVRNCTLVGDEPRPLIFIYPSSSFQMESSIVWGDFPSRLPINGDSTSLNNSSINNSNIVRGWTRAGTGNLTLSPKFVSRPTGDLRLLASSPCIDAGDTQFVSNERDLAGAPRLIDGDLDRAMVVDMGAREFSHVDLAVTGEATPGGSLTVSATGTTGLAAFVAIGPMRDNGFLYSPFGALFFELGPQAQIFSIGTLPASITFPIPGDLSVPITAVFQALALGMPLPSGRKPGNVSNPVTKTIE